MFINYLLILEILKDDQILEIKKVGGLVGLNPYPFFIDTTFKKKEEVFIKRF